MKGIVHGKLGGSLMVAGAFAVWLGSFQVFGVGSGDDMAGGSLAGAVAFFLAACFLPERRPVTFLSRRSALGAMAFLLWFAGNSWARMAFAEQLEPGNSLDRLMLGTVGPFALAFGAYYLSLFLIRGFRAPPEEIPADPPRQPAAREVPLSTREAVDS